MRLVCFVPTEAVLLTTAILPTRGRQRLLQAVPYVLEEHLIDDVDEMHFALGQRLSGDQHVVGVVSRERMSAWLGLLREHGLQADAFVPDVFALPWQPDSWSVYVTGERVLVRTGAQSGFASDPASAPLIMSRALADLGEDAPQRFEVYHAAGATEGLHDWPEGAEINVHALGQGLLSLVADGFDAKAAFNLLQGEYSRRERLSKHLRQWYPAAAVLGAWLVIQLALQIYDYNVRSAKTERLQAEIEQVYRATFPDAKNVPNPRVQMEQALDELRRATGQGGDSVAEILASAAPILRSTGGLEVRTLRYRTGQLDVELELQDLKALDGLKQRLSDEGGWSVEIQSASARGDKVESRMLIKKAGT
jgi:general secretion pathway protein L